MKSIKYLITERESIIDKDGLSSYLLMCGYVLMNFLAYVVPVFVFHNIMSILLSVIVYMTLEVLYFMFAMSKEKNVKMDFDDVMNEYMKLGEERIIRKYLKTVSIYCTPITFLYICMLTLLGRYGIMVV